ncbi:hypothetical protein VTO42DRAFT_247 [Malbranchea cinnamomea]
MFTNNRQEELKLWRAQRRCCVAENSFTLFASAGNVSKRQDEASAPISINFQTGTWVKALPNPTRKVLCS